MVDLTARRGRATAGGNSTEKTLRILEAAAAPGGPHRLADIAAEAELAKATAHRLLGILVADGVLTSRDGRYGIGPRLRAFAAQIVADGRLSVEQLLRALQENANGHTVHLALRSGLHAIYTHKIDADHPYQMASRVGMSLSLHCTAIGKCVLSQLDKTELDEILSVVDLHPRTPATLTDRGHLDAELAQIRERGYAVDDEENEATIRCLAAPVLDHARYPLGGVSVSTVTFAVSRAELETFAPAVLDTAARLSELIGN